MSPLLLSPYFFFFCLFLFLSVPPCTSLLLPSFISSHMVLQQSPAIPRIWGTTLPKNAVTVQLNKKNSWSTISNPEGNWLVEISPQAAGFNNEIEISSTENGVALTILLTDVSFGDVFLCSGQSNMELSVAGAYNATVEIAKAVKYPNMRIYTVAQEESSFPLTNTTSKDPNVEGWAVPTPDRFGSEAFSYFSATCWFYGINVYDKLGGKVPIGLLAATWGGTRIEAWSSPDALAVCNASVSSARGGALKGPNDASHLWYGMIYPLLNYRFRAAVWYQGEQNDGDPQGYECSFPAMINDWRSKFQLPDLYFFFAQLAPFNDGDGLFPPLRQAQLSALILPKVNFAVTIDTNDPASPNGAIHPRDKQDVGYRLALRALTEIYGFDLVADGPKLVGVERTQIPVPSWLLRYSDGQESDGLQLVGSQECVQCCNESPFIIVGSDNSRSRAPAFINSDDRVILIVLGNSLPKDVQPAAIEFDWEDAPECVLMNQYGLPAVPLTVQLLAQSDQVSFY